jgi:TatA/E family protein of Tat protein translocase
VYNIDTLKNKNKTMPFNLSMPEILVIGFLLIIFFGKDKLPQAAQSIGRSFNIFKEELQSDRLADTKTEVKAAESTKTASVEVPKAETVKSEKTETTTAVVSEA